MGAGVCGDREERSARNQACGWDILEVVDVPPIAAGRRRRGSEGRATYSFSRFPMNTFRHPYAMTAAHPTRYHTGRRPRTGILRCMGEKSPRQLAVGPGNPLRIGKGRRGSDLVLNSVVAARGREILRHLVRCARWDWWEFWW